ncbi:NmrA family transcriptional regulator [Pedobacter psychrophilus]|uniref:NmrA family transcriptional regulator n=1 Tax=Pedobacter psychrophilus TaxID=1826909 RepID=A0A179DKM7_9SPHI|nr:NAD(P)H-binding protein [Pedobacter psychrophilus]OAQ41615.1 NmrA family transcriptional regulator [Pedobacter psychrophilus]
MKSKILITLANGKTGFATAKQLLEEGYQIRIFVRSKNEKTTQLEKLGAETVIGNFNNREQLRIALTDIQNVYYCYPYKPGMANDITLFIEEATKAEINAVVFMGQFIAEFNDTGSALTTDIRKCYDLLEKSALNVVYFNPVYFADNAFVIAEYVLQLGLMPSPFGNGKNPWISIDDMSRCLVELLKKPESYFGQKLFITGSKSISPKEMKEIFSQVSGKRILKVNIPDWLFLKAGIMSGMEFGFDKFAIIQSIFYHKQMRMNRFNIEPTNIVKELTGKEPEDFETITKKYFANSKYIRRTFGSWFTTFIKFNKMPFTKVPNNKEIEKINV